MPEISFSTDTSVESLQAAVDLLRKQERKWRNTGSKRALLGYLTLVFRLYAAWKQAGTVRPAATLIARLAGISDRNGRHPIRTIIEVTSKADRRSQSRWGLARRYAWRQRERWISLNNCLRSNGGIAGCASKWADLRAQGRILPGFARVAGEDRVPKFRFASE
jgi:hypothetical protein